MDKLIIHIIRSKQAWPSTGFFVNSLNWNIRKNKNEVDYVDVFNGKDGKALLVIVSDDKDVQTWCLMNGIKCEKPSKNLKPYKLIPFWNGPAYKNLPQEMQSEEDQAIDKIIQEVGEDCQIIHRYPSIKFRASQKLQSMLKKGEIPTLEHFQKEYKKNTELAEDIREKVTWRDDPPAIDPDTDMPYTKEDNDLNKQLLNSYDFNANLAMACAQELSK